MTALTNTDPNLTYKDLYQTGSGVGSGLTGSLQSLTDGFGNIAPIQFSTTTINIVSGLQYNGKAVSFSGAFSFNAILTGNTSVTFPTSGTLATTSQLPTGAALTKTDDTNITLTLGGSPTTALVNAASITAGWTGTLAVARGGIGTGTAGIAAFNNITGYTASGATGTTSTNLVFSTSPTILTPVIAQINTSTGTAMLTTSATSSAVNNINITNNSTGNAPIIGPNGSDSNIDIWIQAKNTGTPVLLGGNTTIGYKLYSGTSQQHLTQFTTSNTSATRNFLLPDMDVSNAVVQRVSTETGAVATGTTVLPFDDSIPQNGEGDQYMTLSITPKSTTSILKIEVSINLANSNAGNNEIGVALFQDSTAGALAAVCQASTSAGVVQNIKLVHIMTSGTVSSTAFKIRAGGGAAGTTTFNGSAGGRIFGGVMASSISITEYAA